MKTSAWGAPRGRLAAVPRQNLLLCPVGQGLWLLRDGAPRGQQPQGFGSRLPRTVGLRYVSVPSQSHWQDEDPWPFVKWRPGSKGLFGPGDACREPSMRGWGAGPPGTAVTDTDTDTPGRGPPAAVCRPGTLTEGESVGDGGGGGKGEAPAGAAGL